MNFDLIVGEKRIHALQRSLGKIVWPEFMQHDGVVNKYWSDLHTHFLSFQFALMNKHEIAGIGNSIALNWQKSFEELPDNGLDWAMKKAHDDLKNRIKPNVQILINPAYQRVGISYKMLEIMKGLARKKGNGHIVLPVRPLIKSD